MSHKILTRKEVRAWYKEIADKMNADLDAMTPEERKEAIAELNAYAARIGGFPRSKPLLKLGGK